MSGAGNDGVRFVAPSFDDDDIEELRLAVVMSGGVSLCVWMGGVAAELDAVRSCRGVYGELLRALGREPVVDVVTGTSAGGINGSLLAASQVWGASLAPLRDLWVEKADFEKLLRSPGERDPRSLLKGDEYLRVELKGVLDGMARIAPRELGENEAGVRLLVTTTLLDGTTRPFMDVRGFPVLELTHLGLFRFDERSADHTPAAPPTGGDFGGEGWTARLALASRCSSAHPGGFEAAYVPIGQDVDDLPDMAEVALWPNSQWALDGGILANRPVQQAIDAIVDQPATRQVRRQLLLVTPQESMPTDVVAGHDKPPSLLQTVSKSLTLPREESIVGALDCIVRHNRRVQDERTSRQTVLQREDDLPRLSDLAAPLVPAWRDGILRRFTSDAIARRVERHNVTDGELLVFDQLLRSVFPVSVIDWQPATNPTAQWPIGSTALIDCVRYIAALLRTTLRLLPQPIGDPSTASARSSLIEIRRELQATLAHIRSIRDRSLDAWTDLDMSAGLFDPIPNTDVARVAVLAQRAGRAVGAATDVLQTGGAGQFAAFRAAGALTEEAEILRRAAACLVQPPTPRSPSVASPPPMQFPRLTDPQQTETITLDDVGHVIRWILSLQILESRAEDDATGNQIIDFTQVSATAPNAFTPQRRPEQKLTGMQLAHFGAFYKQSWRQNDWMWGRLDGAHHLVQLLVDPARLRQLQVTTEQAVDLIRCIATGSAISGVTVESESETDDELVQLLREDADRWERTVRRELAYLDDPNAETPPRLDDSVAWIVRRVQLEIIRAELPALAQSILDDEARGAIVSPDASSFLIAAARSLGWPLDPDKMRDVGNEYRLALKRYRKAVAQCARPPDDALPPPPTNRLAPNDAVELLRGNPVGSERLADDLGSDLSTRVITRAALVAASVGAGERSGLGPLRPVLAGLRQSLRVVYYLSATVLRRTKTTTALVAIVLTTSAAAIAMGVIEWSNSGGEEKLVGLGLAAVLYVAAVVLGAWRMRDSWRAFAFVLFLLAIWIAGVLYVAQRDINVIQKLAVVLVLTISAGFVMAVLEGWVLRMSADRRVRVLVGLLGVVTIVGGLYLAAWHTVEIPAGEATQCSGFLKTAVSTTSPEPVAPSTGSTASVPSDGVSPGGAPGGTAAPGTSATSTVAPSTTTDQTAQTVCDKVRLASGLTVAGILLVIVGVVISVLAARPKKANELTATA